MSYPIVDDPLSSNTARLSISQNEIEEENPRSRVKDLLNSNDVYSLERRNSAVSLNSFAEEDESHNLPSAKSSPKKILQQKRRRSSNQSLNTATPPIKKERKVHKKKLKKQLAIPSIEFQTIDDKEHSKRFPFRNLRSLVLHIFNVPTGQKMKWCKIDHVDKIKNIVICSVNGLDVEPAITEEFKINELLQKIPIENLELTDELSFIKQNFKNVIRTISPGGKDTLYQPLDSISNIPLTKNEKKLILDKSKQDKITIKDLLLNESQLQQYDYPITKVDESWSETITPIVEERESKIFALDCEFCKAGHLQVLTRISVIDFEGEVVFDKLVKPEEEITDYVTKYSGITEELLKDVTTTIYDIQLLFLSTVFKNDILVGHSLESDLKVMKIVHMNIVDTAVIYEHNRGPPSKPSLRWLASNYLARDIQIGEDDGKGHSSIEDALTCLDLVKLKILEGRCFGTNINEIPIFERLFRTRTNETEKNFKSMVISYCKNPSNSEEYVDKHSITNDDEILEILNQSSDKFPNFSIIELKDLEYNLKWSLPSEFYDGKLDHDIKESHKRVNTNITKIYEILPDNTLFLVCSQSKNPSRMYSLQRIRKNFQMLEKNGILDLETLPNEEKWDVFKNDELLNETNLARESLLFMRLKTTTATVNNND
ncbi:hypothetical protein KGF54_004702 [Candida jiufengensis]|uniref:uncharacterized protein n=1 Tax=Candida jiufengensis TaxID=497108 RepID=UPI002225B1C8|nr:uncharacterized protein KGF54_004702 [Candida jiufengensis]KAI5951628.1 hypothetical protein KGF54_004702 [Candida jiufengensis]